MTALGIVVFFVIPVLLVAEVLRCVYLEYRWDRIPILLYHRFISRAPAEGRRVPDGEMIYTCYDTAFAEQMAHLSEAAYTTVDLDDYVRIRSGEIPLPDKPVMITFDDGYLSNYTMAYPVLRRLGLRGVLFVAAEPDEYTRRCVEGVDGFLTADQMREMADNGISIQSHTLTHCVLNELDDETAFYELAASRSRLGAITGRPVEHIAIPRAGYSRRIRRLVRKAGYQTACGTAKGSANGLSDLFSLPRIVVERDMSLDEFVQGLTPRSLVMLRIVGSIKRIPERVGGGRFARTLRSLLYTRRLQPLFKMRNLKRLMAAAALLYLFASVLFASYLIAS